MPQTFKLTAHTLEAAWWRQRYEVQADTIEEAAKKLAAYIENPAEGTTGVDEDGDAREEEHEGRLDPAQNFGDSTLTIRRSGDWQAPPLWTNELPREPKASGPVQRQGSTRMLKLLTDDAVSYLRQVIDRRGNYYELASLMDIDDDTDLQELADSGEVLCVDIVDENDGNPYEYIALEIRIDDEGDLMLIATSVSAGEEIFSPVEGLSAEDLCRLADWVVNLENPK